LSGIITGVVGGWARFREDLAATRLRDPAALTSTEKDNVNTDETQSSNYSRVAGRLS